MSPRARKTLVVLSQVYVPDPASVGQHMHDVAAEMVRRGYRVRVFAADRGYDDPSHRYARSETLDGVEIVRLPLSSFGKSSLAVRLAGGGSFVTQAVAAASALPRIDHVLVSTSPPMCAMAGVALSRLRRAPLTFWAMDINPDQIVATGALAPHALPVRAFDAMNRSVLGAAHNVVALDRYMAERLAGKAELGDKLHVVPPWPHVESAEPLLSHEDNAFRAEHGLHGKFVVMYSGNLSPTHPVTTILDAAVKLRDDPRLLFLFAGGGLGRDAIERHVRAHGLANVRTLPYQPLERLRESLSAADVHLVAMGDGMAGIVHPCKIYGAMAVGRPVLVLGPERCHLTDLVRGADIGWHVRHGDAGAAANLLEELPALAPGALRRMGEKARDLIQSRYSRSTLCGQLCDLLEGHAAPADSGIE
jgi:colanic acid biosynthesis glycosyl transferase WcaI